MEEKSIRIYDSEKTFFSKITSTISKLLIPTKIGINDNFNKEKQYFKGI